MSSVISVENLSKAYRLGQIGTGTLSRDINVWWAMVRGKPNPMLKIGEVDHGNRDGETIWALKDVNFTVEQGEVLGIIGRNGAGKSTLLKILSQVTAPTSGHARVKGRIASLLEVGTGFHPDLTGRENIYLNGAILGMSRKEIDRKLDEIVDFSGIEEYIDTPVKRYSSGMYVRLAFAVAAHLESEILLIDEVLAVGDDNFRKKCLGKMGDVAKGGRTVLYISHDMASILRLCPRSILLEKGRIVVDGMSEEIVAKYILGISNNDGIKAERVWSDIEEAPGDDTVRLLRIRLLDQMDVICGSISMDKDFFVELDYRVLSKISMSVGFQIVTSYGTVVFRSTDWDIDENSIQIREPGLYCGRCRIPAELLNEGRFTLSWIMDDPGRKMIKEHDLIGFEVRAVKNIGGKLDRQGVIRLRLPWQTEKIFTIDSQREM